MNTLVVFADDAEAGLLGYFRHLINGHVGKLFYVSRIAFDVLGIFSAAYCLIVFWAVAGGINVHRPIAAIMSKFLGPHDELVGGI